ncbi:MULTISPECIES: branched-chain amino acid ABC transporter substrate-binding protein [Candidatus Ichthyocystis]|uniref:branched-chain amino acid ABC transporter substrate-binding protein n=1 Tax=Candidatus Ichthyocystis TaxID=2929841 RepID=UPI000A9D0E2C|nr:MULTISPECIES: branched-chain amino acid ABC transporter substrate-binding protein [Ichthyocystis]
MMDSTFELMVMLSGLYSMKRLFVLVSLLNLSLLFSGCFWDKDSTESLKKPIIVKIGQVSPLTGGVAHLGKDCEDGVALAVHELNQQNRTLNGRKLKFELVSLNDMDDPRQATEAAQRIVDSGAVSIIGHLNSGATLPASSIYARHNITQITVSSNIRYTRQGFKTAFRIMAADYQQGKAVSSFAVKDLHLKRIVVIDDQTAYGQGLADVFVKIAKESSPKGAVLSRYYVDSYTTDFGALLAKIKLLHPDAVFFGGTNAQSTPLLRQMRQLGLSIPFITGDMSCMDSFIEQVKKVAAPFYCSTNGYDLSKLPGAAGFIKRFKSFTGHEPFLYSPYTYDATMLVADAIRSLQTLNSEKIAAYLHDKKRKPYHGVTGDIYFDSDGNRENVGVSIYTLCGSKICLRSTVFS